MTITIIDYNVGGVFIYPFPQEKANDETFISDFHTEKGHKESDCFFMTNDVLVLSVLGVETTLTNQ